MTRDQSKRAFAAALRNMPGGVNSPARAFGGVGGEPIFIDRAAGAWLYDVDGNRYIDYVLSWKTFRNSEVKCECRSRLTRQACGPG